MLRIALAQLNLLVGDIDGNTQQIIHAAKEASEQDSDILLCSELSLTGYPPEDLLLRPSLNVRIEDGITELKAASRNFPNLYWVVGYPKKIDSQLFNMAGVILNGQLIFEYAKQHLPNYQVFDEKRYFSAGHQALVVNVKGVSVGITICEDIWHDEPAVQAVEQGAQLLLNLNASPFHMNKLAQREERLQRVAQDNGLAIVYVNQVGGQDELVFDGGSLLINADGSTAGQAPTYVPGVFCTDVFLDSLLMLKPMTPAFLERPRDLEESVYEALVLGVRDYVNKNGFKGIVLGLSGGIDSALTLAIAVDAIGKERVKAIMMPYVYTSSMSLQDAEAEASALGVNYDVLPIHNTYDAFIQTLEPLFAGLPKDTTEENLQARCRGVLLMAVSNKTGYMVLTTGNKSEMAVGYATLYGDMVGGYSALKDVFKTWVYRLARYRNRLQPVIPERVIERAPSAELAPDQVDQDSLPDYDELDAILEAYIEQDLSSEDIISQGFDSNTVRKVVRLVDLNEYKRRQAPVGVRMTEKGFGRDRRYPITSGWKAGK